MLDTQSDVRLVMRDPETPGGFRLSIAWRPTSRSATADAMLSGTVVADELRAMPQYALQGRRDPERRCPDMGETTPWRKPVARESRDEKRFPQCGVSFLAALFGTKVQNPFTRSRLVKCTRAKSLRCRYEEGRPQEYGTVRLAREKSSSTVASGARRGHKMLSDLQRRKPTRPSNRWPSVLDNVEKSAQE